MGGPVSREASECTSEFEWDSRVYSHTPNHFVIQLAGYSWLQQAAVTSPYHPPLHTRIRARMTSFGLTCDAVPDISSRLPSFVVIGDKVGGSTCV